MNSFLTVIKDIFMLAGVPVIFIAALILKPQIANPLILTVAMLIELWIASIIY